MSSTPPRVTATSLPGVLLVNPAVHRDGRGFFVEWFNARTFADAGLPGTFVQDNHSRSTRDVLRGLHFQPGQGKLVHVARGSVFDVAVDVRVGSPGYGRWVGVTLDDRAMNAVWIPPGFAHGFCVLSDEADVVYKCTEVYDREAERGVVWNDPVLAIDWPLRAPRISERDRLLPHLAAAQGLPRFAG